MRISGFEYFDLTGSGPAEAGTPSWDLTVTGQVIGSPNFMPPEQAGSSHGKAGRHSDVYALGGILYYLLTARAPFQAESLEAIISAVLHTEPVSPRLLNPGVPRDLETICLKCLEKASAQRYATAQDLVEELGRFLEGRPIHARPVTRAEQVWRWGLRNPALAASFAAIALLFLVVAIGSPIAIYRINEARKSEAHEKLRTQQNLYAADMNLAQRALGEGDLGRTLALLNSHRPVGNSALRTPRSALEQDLRGWEWRYLWQQCQGDELLTLGRHSNAVFATAFSPDGTLLATASLDHTVKLWDFQKRQIAAVLPHSEPVKDAVFSRDGTLLATGSESRWVRIWEVARQREVARFRAGEIFWHGALAFAPDGQTLAAPDTNHLVGVWDLKTESKLFNLAGHRTNVTALAFTSDGRTLASASFDRSVRFWDLTSQTQMYSLTNFRAGIYAMALSPDDQFLAVGTAGRTEHLKLFDLRVRQELVVLPGHTRYITGLTFSRDSQSLASASADHTLRIYDTTTRKEVNVLRGHTDRVQAAAFAPDGRTLASAGLDGADKLWNPRMPRVEKNRLALTNAIGAALSPDATRFLSWDQDGRCRLWDVETFELISSFILNRTNLRPQ